MEIKAGQQFRIASDGAILTILSVVGDTAACSILRNNEQKPGSLSVEGIKRAIGKNELSIVSLHKGTPPTSDLNESKIRPMDLRVNSKYLYSGGADYFEVVYKGATNKGHFFTKVDGTLPMTLGPYEVQDYIEPIEGGNIMTESRFQRAMGSFTEYTSKVISVLRRNKVDENQDLNFGLISTCYGQRMSARDCASSYLKTLKENKKMKNKNQLNETSFSFNNTSKFILNYDDQDIVKAIKELFADYEGFTCNKISAVGDTQFYNIEVTADIEDEFPDIESKRFVISQKVHKFRSELFTDLSSIFPVVNINMGNYEFTKNSDKIKFTLTLLMSATNQRDWVSGEYKQKDKKLGQKIIDSLKKEEIKESTLNSKLKDILK
ncbi:MAG: hypothetical protein ABIP51_10085 [Bacteroidia bacterium]